MAGYVFSNTKLRDELGTAKDAEAAGKILAKHLQKDGKQVGKEIRDFVQSDVVQDQYTKARQYVNENAKKLKGDLKGMVQKQKTAASKSAAKSASSVQKRASSATKKAPAKKTAK